MLIEALQAESDARPPTLEDLNTEWGRLNLARQIGVREFLETTMMRLTKQGRS